MSRLIKSEVTRGVYWVEAPDADLRVLCGCPADSVKHLIRRGLIRSREAEGITFETGPNAILLSDVMVQRGHFTNLSEFPVLQMLYRQGMILPDHPGNTGVKPLIMGHPDQVVAQLVYIYRGNYGLVSTEELIGAGASEAEAELLMKIKLFFAFGAIRQSDELLDTLFIQDEEAVEIRNGVMVHRVAPNVYEFAYKGETQRVDLNLQGEGYPAPMALPYLQIDRPYFGVVHSGEADGWDPDRPAMSSILMYQGKFYLIDAGPNLAAILNALGINVNEIEGIFHTHCHDDHFAGLTTLIRAGRKIKYFATPLVRASVERKLAALLNIDRGTFGQFFEVHDLAEDQVNEYEGLQIRPMQSPHPVENTIFSFQVLGPEGYRSYGHYADMSSFAILDKMQESEDKPDGVPEAFLDGVRDSYRDHLTIKKIDIGGGLIHGDAEDFRQDMSERIVLAHTAAPLSDLQKEVGSNAPFGIVDVLIESSASYERADAARFLAEYFPETPEHQRQMLLNGALLQHTPGTLLARAGLHHEIVHLLLRGNVERIRPSLGMARLLSAGAIIGRIDVLNNKPSHATYRAASYATSLGIPLEIYRAFIERAGLTERIRRTSELTPWLQRSQLFGEGLDFRQLIQLAESATVREYSADTMISVDDAAELNLVCEGEVERQIMGKPVERVRLGQCFGGQADMPDAMGMFNFRTIDAVTVMSLPEDQFAAMPIVRFKLLEMHQRQMRGIWA